MTVCEVRKGDASRVGLHRQGHFDKILLEAPCSPRGYSTCSISPLENNQVIARLFKSRADQFQVITPRLAPYPGAERTEYGEILLPDRGEGGPIYCAVIEKN